MSGGVSAILAGLIPVLIWGVPFVGLAWFGGVARSWHHKSTRRSPFTKPFLRTPGYSVHELLDEVRTDMLLYIAIGASVAPLAYGVFKNVAAAQPSNAELAAVLAALVGASCVAWSGWKIYGAVRRARDLRLGYEAECAVGQELSQLMRDGFFVFHDVPGDRGFNIDHVVIGPPGVFAVETKGRPKRTSDRESGHKVQYDGQALAFPGWSESAPIEQAVRNAHWLEKWLSSAVGEPVDVTPVLVVPGWFVERTSGSGIAVLNEKASRPYFTKRRGPEVAEPLIRRAAHQLDQRCRDVKPRAYCPVD